MNTYVIGIGGSGFDPSHPGQYNYMYAKFNTKHNLTESLVESNDPDVSERLVDVKVDPVNEQIYVVLDINSNKYKDVSIYEAGDELTENNPNVALVAYSFNNAVINWIKIFGDLNNVDYYVDLEQNIIVLNSYTSMFSENKGTSKDILAYKFRYETGYIIGKLSMGSPSDDTAYDLITHFHGAYILASIGNNFSPHANTGSVWGTPNNETTFAHIWINDNFKLLDIEGYAESSLTTLPMRGFPSIPDVYEPQFMFISPAGKEQLKTGISLYQNGALFTQYSNPLRLFISTDCNLT